MNPDTKKNNGEFQDPLENYDPKTYDDPLEQALAEQPVMAIQHEPFTTIPPELPVHEAISKLASMHAACLLVEKDEQLVGVFSDRDVLNNVALDYEKVKDSPVSEVMTTNPVYVFETDSSAAALTVMADSGFRHVPILDLDHKITGIVSPQRVTGFMHAYFA